VKALEARPVFLLIDGEPPAGLAHDAAHLGLGLGPFAQGMAPGTTPVLVAVPNSDNVLTGLMPPFSGFLDIGLGGMTGRAAEAAASGGLCLSLSTAAAYAVEPAQLVGEVVRRRFGLMGTLPEMVELAVAEALANAVIHGNLEIRSDLRATFDGFQQFSALLTERLGDPAMAARRVDMTLAVDPVEGLIVTVTDQGPGFDIQRELTKPVDAGAKSGRGLALIRKMARSIAGSDGGRTLAMTFAVG
jgi:anti-sigma regulatory factor (Ser/Thr protein kinase)